MDDQISYYNMNYIYEILKLFSDIICIKKNTYLLLKFSQSKKILKLFFPYDSLYFCDVREWEIDNKNDYCDYSLITIEKLLEHIENIYLEIGETKNFNIYKLLEELNIH